MRRSGGQGGALKAVLDTNVVLSALLFGGPTSRLVSLWQAGRFQFLISREILDEYLRALAYPKFGLTEQEIKAVIQEEILSFTHSITSISYRGIPFLKDPHDRKFLACARSARANSLVTGDKGLLSLVHFGETAILGPKEFVELLGI